MEDILASIKRIIAEDSEAVGARPPKARREALAAVPASPMPTRDAEHDPSESAEEALQAEPASASDGADATDVLELTSPMPEVVSAEAPANFPATASIEGDGLLSSTSAAASRSAFAALNQLQVRSDDGQSNTLEGLVSELLKPMLREWLDRELPALVERLVSAEVSRLSGRS